MTFISASDLRPPTSDLDLKVGLQGAHLEAFSVKWCKAKLLNGFTVFSRSIAFIAVPFIFRIVRVKGQHEVIPIGFRQHTGGCNGGEVGIAFDHAFVGYAGIGGEQVSVNEDKAGLYGKLVQGKVHGLERRAQDIDPVDLLMVNAGHGPGNGFIPDHFAQFIPVRRLHQLGVVQQGVFETFGKDDGSGKYRARETAPARLVAARFDQFVLEICP